MFSTFQYLNILFVVNLFSINKKRFYHNYWFLLYHFLIILYNICICVVKEFKNSFFGNCLFHINSNYDPSLEKRVQNNRVFTLLFVVCQITLSILYEYAIEKYFLKKELQLKQQLHFQTQQKEHQLVNSSNNP